MEGLVELGQKIVSCLFLETCRRGSFFSARISFLAVSQILLSLEAKKNLGLMQSVGQSWGRVKELVSGPGKLHRTKDSSKVARNFTIGSSSCWEQTCMHWYVCIFLVSYNSNRCNEVTINAIFLPCPSNNASCWKFCETIVVYGSGKSEPGIGVVTSTVFKNFLTMQLGSGGRSVVFDVGSEGH